jgi:hypothetical protein
MIEDMIPAGLARGTQKLYVQAVRELAAHYRRPPNQLSEEEVRSYLLGLRQRRVARGTFQTSHYGLRFYYQHTLGRGDCRKFWGVSAKGVFSRRFFDREWTRGLDCEVGEDRC